MESHNAILNGQSLSYLYHSGNGVHAANLTIYNGEFVVILGPNGAGKSTLIKLLGGVLKPQNGDVLINNKSLSKYKPKDLARIMAYVPQKVSILFSFTVFEFVLMGRAPYLDLFGWASQEDYDKVNKILSLTHIMELKDRIVGELSGGELQRVLLAQALVQETKLLLLDEPLTHLDLTYQIEFMEFLKNANKQNKLTILLVLHDINLAAQYADRLILIQNGKIAGDGTPDDLITKETLEKLYTASVDVFPHPLTGKPVVLPVPKHFQTINY